MDTRTQTRRMGAGGRWGIGTVGFHRVLSFIWGLLLELRNPAREFQLNGHIFFVSVSIKGVLLTLRSLCRCSGAWLTDLGATDRVQATDGLNKRGGGSNRGSLQVFGVECASANETLATVNSHFQHSSFALSVVLLLTLQST